MLPFWCVCIVFVVHVSVDMHVYTCLLPIHTLSGEMQRKTSAVPFTWELGIELRSLHLHGTCSWRLSHFLNPQLLVCVQDGVYFKVCINLHQVTSSSGTRKRVLSVHKVLSGVLVLISYMFFLNFFFSDTLVSICYILVLLHYLEDQNIIT